MPEPEPTALAMRLATELTLNHCGSSVSICGRAIKSGFLLDSESLEYAQSLNADIARALDAAGVRALVKKRDAINAVVDEQANDETIWFCAEYATEAFLQEKLRRLHEVIEGISQADAARAALRKVEK